MSDRAYTLDEDGLTALIAHQADVDEITARYVATSIMQLVEDKLDLVREEVWEQGWLAASYASAVDS